MMTEKTRVFLEHRALELMLCWSDPQSHKRIGCSVRGFDHTFWEGKRVHPFFRYFGQVFANPAMNRDLFNPGSMLFTQASFFDTVGRVGLRVDDPDAHDPKEKTCSVRLFLPSTTSFATI